MVVRMIARSSAALLLAVCLPHQALALGLGDIELDSHLNERFSASIPLYDAEGLQATEVIVSLATREDFERVGVERFFFLTSLRFAVEMADGEPVIRVSSAQPMAEPYLNFLVEVLWPQGRLLKEYTVLLDPPTYTATVQAPVRAEREVVSAPPARSVAPSPPPPSGRVSGRPSQRGTQVSLGGSSSPRGEMMTGRSDTLWSVAYRNRPSEQVSVNQYMLAIQRANPEAFIDGNINLMKAGYVLRMPSQSEAQSLTVAEATAEVSRQADVWRGIARPAAREQVAARDTQTPELRQQVDATTDRSPAAPREQVEGGTLQIVAGEGDVAQGTSRSGSQVAEENERLSREIDELSYQLDRERQQSTDQIAVRDRRLEVQDQELAALREQLEKTRAELKNLNQRPQSPTQSRPADDAGTPFWKSPSMTLAAGAAALVLALIGAFIWFRRRQQASHDAAYAEAVNAPQAEEAAGDFMIGDVSDSAAGRDTEDEELDDAFDLSGDESADPEVDMDILAQLEEEGHDDDQVEFADDLGTDDVGATSAPSLQTSDVIGEADIYAAYGRYPHAIGLLTGALEEDPNRHDVRLKLLEVAVAGGDRQTFDSHLPELMERCSDQDILLAARELEDSLPEGEESTFDDGDDSSAGALAAGVVAAGAGAAGAYAGQSEEDDESEFDLLDELDDLDSEDTIETTVDDLLGGVDDTLTDEVSVDGEIPELDELEQLGNEVDELLQGVETGDGASEQDDDFDLSFEDDILGGVTDESEEAQDLGGAGDLLGGTVESEDDSEFDLGLDNDDGEYETLDDQVGGASDDNLLGGDLGMDFDPDKQSDAASDDEAQGAGLDLTGDDDLEIEDLLAELDADSDLLGEADTSESFGTVTTVDEADDDLDVLDDVLSDLEDDGPAGDPQEDEDSAQILSFSRSDDADVPALDEVDHGAGLLGGVTESDSDDDLFEDDLLGEADAADTKLDLAQAYIDMGDEDGARDILGEVLQEGSESQRNTAQNLLDGLAS